jgi:PAS domain S-box-containing protein
VIYPVLPIWFTDISGSILMIILSFLCLTEAFELKKRDQTNVIWTYLLWVCVGLSGFAISRSAGHILKQYLLFSEYEYVWHAISPLSGAVNTMTFVFVASITLFFERTYKIHQQVLKDKQALQSAHEKLFYLNQNLEHLVAKRTASLAVSENKYRRIFEVSMDMILVSTADGSIVDVNPAGYKMLGYNGKDKALTARKFQDFFADEKDWEALIDPIVQKGFVLNREVILKRIDGSEISSLVSGSLGNESSKADSFINFLVRDIEQRRLIEKQMAQTDKLASLGQLSAGVAHGINNPLGIILGYTQLLMRDEQNGSERLADLKIIEKHVKNCKLVVEDLLNFASSSKTEKEAININEAIDEVLNFISHHSELYQLEIKRDYDNDLPLLLLDEKKIKQVFMNLIMNAKDASGKAGTISLSTDYDPSKKEVTIKVSDTGCGIKKKNLSRIFDPFFTTKPTGEGTGLGLSVSYGIIENHGGKIMVESEPGRGSTFTVSLTADLKHKKS